jgi:hypothetical protein
MRGAFVCCNGVLGRKRFTCAKGVLDRHKANLSFNPEPEQP